MKESPNMLFSNVHKTDPLQFWEDDEIDCKKVSDFLELGRNDLSKLAEINKQSVRFGDRIPPILKERLEQIANVCSLVAEYFEGDKKKTALWFKTPNPMLGDVTPRDMIRLGRYKKLIKFVTEALNKHDHKEDARQ
jgi:hypothetical protein